MKKTILTLLAAIICCGISSAALASHTSAKATTAALIADFGDFVDQTGIIPTFTNDPTYPWTIDGTIKSTNCKVANSSSTLKMEFSSTTNIYFSFELHVNNYNSHKLTLKVDGEDFKDYNNSSWQSVVLTLPAGSHTIEFIDINFDRAYDYAYTELRNIIIKEMPNLGASLLTETSIPMEFYTDNTSYPWLPVENGLKSTNAKVKNSSSNVYSTVTITKPSLLTFNYNVTGYNTSCNAFLFWDGDGAYEIIGDGNGRTAIVLTPGTHELKWQFDMYDDTGNYYCIISNVELKDNWETLTTETNGQVGKSAIYKFDRLDNPELNLLKIVGPIGAAVQDDWNDIRNMTYLSGLDLSEAEFDYLPNNAFNGLGWLSFVILPNNITSIGNSAFVGTQIWDIDIPDSVTSIGTEAFKDTKLHHINFGENTKLETIGYRAFYNVDKLYEFIMPNTVTTLGRYNNYSGYESDTFRDSDCLEKISFSDKLIGIPKYTCYNCGSLKDVKLPSNLSYIEEYAFYRCNIQEIDFPQSLEWIDKDAFEYNDLRHVKLPRRLTGLGNYTFAYNNNLKYIELSSYCNNYNYIFRDCPVDTVVCYAPNPPAIADDPFYGRDRAQVTLLVPEFALADYKLNNYWNKFGKIEPFDDDVDYWRVSGYVDLTDEHRMGGKPDMDIYYGGKLTVLGNDPIEYSDFKFFVNEGNPGSLVNKVESFTADSITTIYPIESGYWYFFTPMYDVNLSDVRHSNSSASFAIRRYNPANRALGNNTSSWENVTSGKLSAGIGYIIQSNQSGDIIFPSKAESRNIMFETEAKATVLETNESENVTNKNWNFVGNPFPCYFDIYYLDFTAPITVWDRAGKKYIAKSITDDAYALKPMQAFFVQKPDEIENIVFATDGRQHIATINRPESVKSRERIKNERYLFNISLSGNDMSDATRVVINDKKSLAYEIECDASKFLSMDQEMPQIFTVDNDNNWMAINERPQVDGIVELGMTIGMPGRYTISLDGADGEVALIDRANGTTTYLNTKSYTFTVDEPCTITGRFCLAIAPNVSSIINTVDTAKADVVSSADGISVNLTAPATIEVYNMSGVKVYETAATTGMTEIAVEKGIYVVRVGATTSKVVVK